MSKSIPLPPDVKAWIHDVFASCNQRISAKLSRIPTAHETSLDMTFVEHFSEFSAPIRFPSEWIVTLDTHYLGGMRHFYSWEIADIGLLIVFRRAGKAVLTKVALLQSKRLYPVEEEFNEDHPAYYTLGFGRLLKPDASFASIAAPRAFSFDQTSRYKALRVKDEQYEAIRQYETKHKIPVHYLLYHPVAIPWSVVLPAVDTTAALPECEVGCRVTPARDVRKALNKHDQNYSPVLGDLQFLLPAPFTEQENAAGWRVEDFVTELVLTCKEGYVAEDVQQDEGLFQIFNRRSGPIAAAIAITFDAPGV